MVVGWRVGRSSAQPPMEVCAGREVVGWSSHVVPPAALRTSHSPKSASMNRGTIPGASGVPAIEYVLPEPVWP